MNIIPEPLSGGSRLSYDYINHYEQVGDFYGGSHRDPKSWKQRVDWLDQNGHRAVNRQALADCLRSYNERHHNRHEAVHKSIALLEREDALVIVGGQQSGLFTGPMLVAYKAMTIIQAAREAEARLGRPVVPVFWIAGEDHDWDEVNHTFLPAQDEGPVKIKMNAADSSRTSVSYTPVNAEQWETALGEMQNLLEDSPHKKELMSLLRQTSLESSDLSEAFARLMGECFGRYGLILMDSADPQLRALEKPVFEQMIRENEKLTAAYIKAASELKERDYELQAEVNEDGLNLFYLHEGKRLLLFKDQGRFSDRKGLVSMTEEELLAELAAHPEKFSNNVLTRPLMQDAVLPVLGAVLGQGEIAYWSITRYAFKELDLQMPLILPRMSFSLVDSAVPKVMDKYGLTLQDVLQGLEDKRSQWLAEQDHLDLDQRFLDMKDAFSALYAPLIQDLGELQPGLQRLGDTNRQKILEQMDFLLQKTKSSLEQQHSASLRQWDRLQAELAPMNRPQERVYNLFYFVNRYGPSFLDRLMDIAYDDSGVHRVIYL
ncbi:bacillithiol biosynthesis cysteine-adding enzyme BshC [Paenibacillus lemnae]|uniref:Putative cysteine ligase BshC n=1 Tax=Paenibacillus lemnae TaxID=1330551 RepID=A0A848M1H4_PAELE|nr:bacillithiol biosynthesis cysteine-adding enzyme BshC [Paenibacillus lemnae]NMO94788.1 bacillithiol biosynthesis cysteine-adding enzyme BshC [Paenibacillus lemnae]